MYSIIDDEDVDARKYFAFLLINGNKVILFSRLDIPIASPSKVVKFFEVCTPVLLLLSTIR